MCIRDRLSSVENKSSTDARSTFFALLFKFQHLLRQISIPLCHFAARVMGENTFSLCADFLCTDRMGDLCAEYFDLLSIDNDNVVTAVDVRLSLIHI